MRLRTFVWRVLAAHMLTYFAAGFAAYTLFDYTDLYAHTELRHLMRPTSSAWVAAGPALQVVRGTMFGLVLWPFADRVVQGAGGALRLWALMLGLAVLGTAGPSPGSLEGMMFTTLPLPIHLVGLPEVVVQTGLFAAVVAAWYARPARWMDVGAALGLALVVAMSGLGVLAARGVLPAP